MVIYQGSRTIGHFRSLPKPRKKLNEGIHLIIVSDMGKSKKFNLEASEPGRLARQHQTASLN